ncbi:hypothetical protein QUC32_28700 (plasmid) [Novosphingobium resinovorum]|uniref:hypothetical protein n=1 Tax=Novosphingobium TaxID=165696 RepID=UPI0012EA238F|nr:MULTISPECIES: hypothetical protein [Novosphingobium]MBF7015656.1 hypothetical protein [Novosphingobium sp. HR1a]WJM30331.1 hypothetical protein QUC32_28700 [Novosphingobium resinovorum]
MSENENELKLAEKLIIDAVEEHWNKNQRAFLLSTLGSILKRQFGDTSALFPKGLKDFLREWPVVALVQHPDVQEKTGLIPATVPIPDDISALFAKGHPHLSEPNRVSYVQAFWDAFHTPIEAPRFVSIKTGGFFEIVDGKPDANDVNYEITAADIAPTNFQQPMAEKVAATQEKISAWLARHSLDHSTFARKRSPRDNRIVSSSTDMLKQVFSKLSHHDQARISIPLDIVLKLIS